MKPTWRRWIARGLVGVLLFGQFAVAAYACPRLASALAGVQQAESPRARGASMEAEPGAAAANSMPADCSQAMGGSDVAQPNLCAEYCKAGQQSDHVPGLAWPPVLPVLLYRIAAPPLALPGRRPAATSVSALLASTPPHFLLHCVRRT